MILRQLIDRDLGCACYLLGDAGRAAVVDPGLDVDRIFAVADEEGLTIELVIETHVHADHVSGRGLLAARTGAEIRLPAGGGQEPGAGEPFADGAVVELGALRIEALAAPGHRPEHLALLVSDTTRGERPWLLLSGDSLLVGDLARPDLAIDPRDGAHALHATLARLAQLPDGVELWPGHVGGSLCGGPGLSRKTSSTLGFERAANPLLSAGEAELAERLIGSLPDRPPTVEQVVARNRRAQPAPEPAPPQLAAGQLAAALDDGAVLLDGRAAEAFDAAHLAGSLTLPLRGSGLGTRAAWLLDPEQPLAVLAASEHDGRELARRLQAVGLGPVVAVAVAGRPTRASGPDAAGAAPASSASAADAGELASFASAGLAIVSSAPVAVAELPALVAAGAITVVDVRDVPEWRDGHVADGVHLPLPLLRGATGSLPDGPLAVACKAGPRAAFAASWLRARGFDARRVADGGIPDLPAAGLALVAA
jgi:glyoxylase-like metal-dependent hydrolase (beta-lactamase superfamily II)/rhodanese-related sulfurtransferase